MDYGGWDMLLNRAGGSDFTLVGVIDALLEEPQTPTHLKHPKWHPKMAGASDPISEPPRPPKKEEAPSDDSGVSVVDSEAEERAKEVWQLSRCVLCDWCGWAAAYDAVSCK